MKIARETVISGYVRYPEMRFTNYGMPVITWQLVNRDTGQVINCQAWAALAERLANEFPDDDQQVFAVCTGRMKMVEWEDMNHDQHRQEVFTAATVTIQPECKHENISWHGSRSECQDCGEIVIIPNANYEGSDNG